MLQHEPDVAFGLHPDLGVIAAVADDNQYLLAVLDEYGFKYDASLDLSVVPSEVPHSKAVRMVAALTWELKHSGWMVDVAPAVSMHTVLDPIQPSAAAPTRAAQPDSTPEERTRARAARAASPQLPAAAPSNPPPPAPPTTAPPRGAGRTR
ncbi:hypothetical protein GTW40_27430 [Streptomyces sp. SID4985]|uniref:hypothetical protein n=1 Tax=Streptomyces sp. SID4985 TaxID=2690292 RepID=UPI00136F405D|nr:hypothetical protein [Streptomyces sp. SID4985]MYQ48721.1 hypothetical protein [Streptomyces sp. SID4985]